MNGPLLRTLALAAALFVAAIWSGDAQLALVRN